MRKSRGSNMCDIKMKNNQNQITTTMKAAMLKNYANSNKDITDGLHKKTNSKEKVRLVFRRWGRILLIFVWRSIIPNRINFRFELNTSCIRLFESWIESHKVSLHPPSICWQIYLRTTTTLLPTLKINHLVCKCSLFHIFTSATFALEEY